MRIISEPRAFDEAEQTESVWCVASVRKKGCVCGLAISGVLSARGAAQHEGAPWVMSASKRCFAVRTHRRVGTAEVRDVSE